MTTEYEPRNRRSTDRPADPAPVEGIGQDQVRRICQDLAKVLRDDMKGVEA